MAEEIKNATVEQPVEKPVEQPKEEQKDDKKEKEPTVQELMVEMAKLKRAQEKASSEAADYKKKWQASLSEQEKASMEKAEAEAKRQEEWNAIVRENKINKVEKTYLAMGWNADESSRMAIAEVDDDFDGKIRIQREVDARKKKEYEAEIFKTIPNVNIGGSSGKTYTKEQFDAMSPIEMTKLKRENPAEYDRLMAL